MIGFIGTQVSLKSLAGATLFIVVPNGVLHTYMKLLEVVLNHLQGLQLDH